MALTREQSHRLQTWPDLLEACKKADYELSGFLGCCSDAEKKDSFTGFVEATDLTEAAIAQAEKKA